MASKMETENVFHEAQTAEHVAQLFDDHLSRSSFKSMAGGGAEMTRWAEAPKLEAWELLQERLGDDARFAFLLLQAAAGGR
jgi:hypothetical protein